MTTKTLDSKGRVTLGLKFAGQTVVIDDSNPSCIQIRPVVLIPAEEAWLYQNQVAIDRVRKGLADAIVGNFADKGHDIENDLDWLGDVED